MSRTMFAAIVFAWLLAACFAIVGIAATYIAIWQQSEQWGWTAFASIALAAFGALGAAFLTGEAS